MLEVEKLSGGYPGNSVLENLSFTVRKGELFGILGPNGSGKTTLLKMLSGLIKPETGSVTVNGKMLEDYKEKELARKIAVLPQLTSEMFAYSVKETVALGRYAHQKGLFQSWAQQDEEAVQSAMELTGVRNFADSAIQELSGGERQRVFLAQALAQQPEILLLDEPTNHLDLAFQKELLDRLSTLARTQKLTVVSIFHDMNLAGLYCDRLLLLENGKMHGLGEPFEILRGEEIGNVYQTEVVEGVHPHQPRPQLLLEPAVTAEKRGTVALSGFFEFEAGFGFRSPVPLRIYSLSGEGSGSGWHRAVMTEPGEALGDTLVCGAAGRRVRTGEISEDFDTCIFAVSEEFLWVFIDGKLAESDFVGLVGKLARLHPGSIAIGATQTGERADTHKIIRELKNTL